MKLLFLLAFAAVGQCALLGSKKCTYGPSYWCSHIQHAKECSAMQHCITTVWKNQQQGLTGSTESCVDVIKVLDDVRHSGASDVLEKMAASCTEMPAEKRLLCKELMMKNQNEVRLLLQSDLLSVNIASALGLCGSLSDSVPYPHVEKDQTLQQVGNYCTDCLKFFGDIQEMVNKSEEKIAEVLKEKFCTKLGYFENLCNQTVDTYGGFVLSILEQQLNPQDWCFLLRFCKSETHSEYMKSIEYVTAKRQLHGMECDLCEKITKDIQNELRNTTLQKDILTALEDDACPLLPGDLAAQCKSFLTEYGSMVFQLIAELDPVTLCQTLGFCSGTETEKKLTVVPLGDRMTSVHLLAPEHKDRASGPVCTVCKEIVEELESMVNTSATKEEILEALEKICSLLPEEDKTECDSLVEQYGPQIVELLFKELPEGICAFLGLCFLDKPVYVDHPVPVKDDQICLDCKMVVTYVRSYLNNPDNVKTIEDMLDKVCIIVPSSYREMCEEIINTYTPTLLILLNQYDDPVKVCTELGMCNGTKTKNDKSVQPAHPLKLNKSVQPAHPLKLNKSVQPAHPLKLNKSVQPAHPLKFLPMAKLQPAMPHLLCSQGPTVVCANEENARRCNAVEHCVKYYNLKVEA